MAKAGKAGGRKAVGRRIVPWSSSSQWFSIRDGLFSSCPDAVAAALRRISGWRSRLRVLVPIDVTTAFIEVQRMDPTVMGGDPDCGAPSVEVLVMLYSMAIMRLVNSFVEPAKRQAEANNQSQSINKLAESIGIQRVLVDIRHEGSHRTLPSLPLLRLAAAKALEWLHSKYWEPQRYEIPNANIDMVPILERMVFYLKSKNGDQHDKVKGPLKRDAKVIAEMYSLSPSETVSVLLNFFQLDTSYLNHMDPSYSDTDLSSVAFGNMKSILATVARAEPRVLLCMLKAILEKIDTKVTQEVNGELSAELCDSEAQSKAKCLCSLALLIVRTLKELKDSGDIVVTASTNIFLGAFKKRAFYIAKLLQKFIALSIVDERHVTAAVLLVEMIGDEPMKGKLKCLPLLSQDSRATKDSKVSTGDTILKNGRASSYDDSLVLADEFLSSIKLRLKERKDMDIDDPAVCNAVESGPWRVTKSWIPCPIGMVPCSLSLVPVLPPLDVPSTEVPPTRENARVSGHKRNESEAYPDGNPDEDERAVKKTRSSTPETMLDLAPALPSCVEDGLLIDGVWRTPTDVELCEMQSKTQMYFGKCNS